jgi:hypothetical protein
MWWRPQEKDLISVCSYGCIFSILVKYEVNQRYFTLRKREGIIERQRCLFLFGFMHPPYSFPVSLHWQPVPVLKNSFILQSTRLKIQEDPEDAIENPPKIF